MIWKFKSYFNHSCFGFKTSGEGCDRGLFVAEVDGLRVYPIESQTTGPQTNN